MMTTLEVYGTSIYLEYKCQVDKQSSRHQSAAPGCIEYFGLNFDDGL